ncbi:MAG: helix-turn-helix transcriptional regulator [Tenericutes bacterium]|nr:helix-turn-helix transcriptional regulator [Mycoplasmatota bacterium]
MKKFKFNLKDIRNTKNLSQTELGNMVNTSQKQISKYELSKEQPTLNRLVELAIALDVTLQELVEIQKMHDQDE